MSYFVFNKFTHVVDNFPVYSIQTIYSVYLIFVLFAD